MWLLLYFASNLFYYSLKAIGITHLTLTFELLTMPTDHFGILLITRMASRSKLSSPDPLIT